MPATLVLVVSPMQHVTVLLMGWCYCGGDAGSESITSWWWAPVGLPWPVQGLASGLEGLRPGQP